jgi:hypothetical protein
MVGLCASACCAGFQAVDTLPWFVSDTVPIPSVKEKLMFAWPPRRDLNLVRTTSSLRGFAQFGCIFCAAFFVDCPAFLTLIAWLCMGQDWSEAAITAERRELQALLTSAFEFVLVEVASCSVHNFQFQDDAQVRRRWRFPIDISNVCGPRRLLSLFVLQNMWNFSLRSLQDRNGGWNSALVLVCWHVNLDNIRCSSW